MISINVNVPLSSGEGIGVRLYDGFVNAHGWILYVGLRVTNAFAETGTEDLVSMRSCS